MPFAVGYQLSEPDQQPFSALVARYREHVTEVYFPWGDMPSGRAALTQRRGYTDWSGQQRLEADLLVLRQMGISLDLLFNANCYGGNAVSQYLQHQVISVLDHLGELVGGVQTVTTTSPAVAWVIKQEFPQVEVRASVNMRIGTVRGMQYVAHLFDGYYVQRDRQRNREYVEELKEWTDSEGKRLYMLANSGCLGYCSGQTFHDNLVAHEKEVDESLRMEGFRPHVCWNFLADRDHWPAILQSSWIRPEDLQCYEDLVPLMKLATRMHARPELVLNAYTTRRCRGNLLDLFEPGFAPALAPYAIDNDRFPADWYEMTSTCDQRCHKCGYCEQTLKQVLLKVE